ncbi:MAG TPA: sigma-70 family RNA polymerase sigma factor [Acidobacteriota bacterium]|nr:sigma-70 family RNA polymerase sigma factor [Acidobacteriota bacterium]
MTDNELIQRIKSRDKQAFDLFYDRYAQIIFSLCVRILRDTGEAEDVLQEIFVQIWKEAERFDASRASVKTWLFTIARSRSLDRYRSRKTMKQRFEDGSSEELHQISSNEDLQSRSVLQQYVANALQQLTKEQKIVLELCYYRGLTQEEIAEMLGEPLGTIKSRIRAALLKLRSSFAGDKSNV